MADQTHRTRASPARPFAPITRARSTAIWRATSSASSRDVRFEALSLTEAALDKLLASPAGVRAVALVQVGQEDRAGLELFALDDWNEPITAQAMLALAYSYGRAKLGFEIGKRLLADGVGYSEETLDPVLYPVPPWRPDDGFIVDRAPDLCADQAGIVLRPEGKEPARRPRRHAADATDRGSARRPAPVSRQRG